MTKPNWKNKTIFTGDNLPIMRGMNSESVDLIYLDPPFNSKANYAAPVGSIAAGTQFKDTWTLNDLDIAWIDLIEAKHLSLSQVIKATMTKNDKSYLIYMAIRILEMKRILKPTGSIYLHCDPTMSHYLKLIMDAVFGRRNFRNELIWNYETGGIPRADFSRKHDVIFRFAKTKNLYFFPKRIHEPRSDEVLRRISTGIKGATRATSPTRHPSDVFKIPAINAMARERTGYPTQKPLALLDKIIKSSSNKNHVVFDPFCGCATSCVAADSLQRQWIGIDISPKAVELVKSRIKGQQGNFTDIIDRNDIPQRTDIGKIPKYNSTGNKKYLYGEQAGYCNGCRTHFEIQHLEVDHIISKDKGGQDFLENLQLLCAHCNKIKGNRGQEYLIVRLKEHHSTRF